MILKKTSRAGRHYKVKRRIKHIVFILVCLLLVFVGFFAAGPFFSLVGR